MKVIVTAGPTREYIDSVRFITNASSGRMGCAITAAVVRAGGDVTLILAEGLACPEGCSVVRFASVEQLSAALDERFAGCDALVMAAAVGDFRPKRTRQEKLSRQAGPVTLELIPTPDVLAGAAAAKRPNQKIIAFAVQPGSPAQALADARDKMLRKAADYIVVNTPEAMGSDTSLACILSREGVVLPWAERRKDDLAEEIVRLL